MWMCVWGGGELHVLVRATVSGWSSTDTGEEKHSKETQPARPVMVRNRLRGIGAGMYPKDDHAAVLNHVCVVGLSHRFGAFLCSRWFGLVQQGLQDSSALIGGNAAGLGPGLEPAVRALGFVHEYNTVIRPGGLGPR